MIGKKVLQRFPVKETMLWERKPFDHTVTSNTTQLTVKVSAQLVKCCILITGSIQDTVPHMVHTHTHTNTQTNKRPPTGGHQETLQMISWRHDQPIFIMMPTQGNLWGHIGDMWGRLKQMRQLRRHWGTLEHTQLYKDVWRHSGTC